MVRLEAFFGSLCLLAAAIATSALEPVLAQTASPAPSNAAAPAAGPIRPEIAARLGRPLGNVTFTPDGRTFISHHPMFETAIRVSEMTSPTELKAFPSLAWNTPLPLTDEYLDAVLGIRSDSHGVVWMLDMGSRSGIKPKFVAWDTRKDALQRIIRIDAATVPTSEPNDFVIDERHGALFIADEGVGRGGDGAHGALIVVTLADGKARRVLDGDVSTRAENRPILIDGRELIRTEKDGSSHPMRVGADGVALDAAAEWLYFCPLTSGAVYRIRVTDLLDASLPDGALAGRVERYADKPNSGGMSIDAAGNLYLTEVEHRAIGVISAIDRVYRRYAEAAEMLWPDGVSAGADGQFYVTIAQLPKAGALNGGARNADVQPHLLMRFPPLAPGRLGH